MDLTKEQIDQLAELQLRRLEREYQQVIKADGSMTEEIERARREMGTPNLDQVVQEYQQQQGLDISSKPEKKVTTYEMSDEEPSGEGTTGLKAGYVAVGTSISEENGNTDQKAVAKEQPESSDHSEDSDEEITTYKGFEKLPEDELGYFIPGSVNVHDFGGSKVPENTEQQAVKLSEMSTKTSKQKPVFEEPIVIDRTAVPRDKNTPNPQAVMDTFKSINFEAPKWAKG